MSFVTIGVNHSTAPVALREKIAFTPDSLIQALSQFASTNSNDEVVILSTCNRTELYLSTEQLNTNELVDWLRAFHSLDPSLSLHPFIYEYSQTDCIAHLMRVASGLDSLILGEPQILGQVKQAYNEAKRVGTVGPKFERLFQTTFAVAKQVRSQTDIGASAVSVAYAAVQLSKQIFSKLSKCRCLLVGAGETIELVGRHLVENNIKSITVANRTLDNAKAVAQKLGGDAIAMSQVPTHLVNSDVVISSTASALPLIGAGMVSTALKQRKYRPMLLIDLAVPRDIESEVAALDEAYLYTVDDLQDIIDANLANREQAASEANKIVEAKSAEFMQTLQQSQHVDLIKEYRAQMQETSQTLLTKAMISLQQGIAAETVLIELNNKLSNQLMHGPTKAIQHAIKSGDQQLMEILKTSLIANKQND